MIEAIPIAIQKVLLEMLFGVMPGYRLSNITIHSLTLSRCLGSQYRYRKRF